MKLLCRIGWHDWLPWEFLYKKEYRDFYYGYLRTYKTTKIYIRKCAHCAIPNKKELK